VRLGDEASAEGGQPKLSQRAVVQDLSGYVHVPHIVLQPGGAGVCGIYMCVCVCVSGMCVQWSCGERGGWETCA
jgi:hypothetical protein